MSQLIDILIVDDEARNLDVLELVLTNPGYRLIRAGSGDEALRLLLKHDVAAMVVDIRMPGLNGLELAEIIKSNRRFQEIPIVFLTAHMMDDQDVLDGYGAGGVDYLTKPFQPAILRQKVAVFAELFRKTRALNELNATLEARVSERTAELEKSEAALKQAALHKDEFLAMLAHELRNPLAPLRMGLDLLLRSQARPAEFDRTLTVMNRQLVHMVRLIDDLLDVGRISGGVLELKKEPADLVMAIQTAIEANKPSFAQRRQSLEFEPVAPLLLVADPTRLAQIVGNLLHNASKFSPDGGHVKVALRHEGDTAFVEVIDSGIGIAPDQLPRVFDMFVRVEREQPVSSGGLGIGLALARRLAEMHGGTLTASSPGLGQGSVFTLALTASIGQVAEGEPTSTQPMPARNAGLDVVIIEDNEDSAELLALWLQERGYRVSVAHNGPDGVTLIANVRPAVVLCDIGLPGMDGIEVCRTVRKTATPPAPVMIALTGWGMAEDRRRTQEHGFDHHLVKPVEPALLFGLLESVD